MKIGREVSELWMVENRPLPLTWPMAYTTACTTVQAVILQNSENYYTTNTTKVYYVHREKSLHQNVQYRHLANMFTFKTRNR